MLQVKENEIRTLLVPVIIELIYGSLKDQQ